MPITAYVSTDNTPGTAGANGNYYKELTFTVATGDRIFAWGTSADANTSGVGDVTSTGATVDSWQQLAEYHVASNAGFESAYATVTAGGSITVRVDIQTSISTALMTVGAWVVPSGEWGGAPTFVGIAGTPATGLASINVPSTSNVMYAMGDWNAGTVGTTTSPAGGTVDERYIGSGTYCVFAAHWASQAAGTTSYGSSGGSGQLPRGVVIAQPTTAPSGPQLTHDAQTVGVAYTATGSQTTSHAGSASARAAVVLIDQNGTAADEVSGVTYGGVAMTRLRFDTEATEAGAVYIYWLDNIPTGTQNVVMTTTASTNKQLVVATMLATSGYGVAVAGHNSGTSTSVSNPSWTITGLTAGNSMMAYEVIHSGLTTMTTTPAASWTLISSTDLGAQGRGFARQAVSSSGTSLASGWTASTADDFVGSSVAFQLVALGTDYTSSPADSEAITDSATDLMTMARTQADPEGITDSAPAVQGNVRSQGDPVGLTDSATATISLSGSPADSVGLTDATSQVATVDQTSSDSVGLTDSVSAVLSGATSTVFGTAVPGGSAILDASAYNFGTVIQCVVAGNVTAIRFYQSPDMATQTVTVRLYVDSNTTAVREATYALTGGTAQWVEVPITPYAVTAGQYVMAAYTTTGYYWAQNSGMIGGRTSSDGNLIAPESPVFNGTGSNGRYTTNVTAIPDQTYQSTAYFADLVLSGVAGSNNYSNTPGDNVGLSDSAAVQMDLVQSPGDSVGLTDSVTSSINLAYSSNPADPEGITDSTSWQAAVVESQADPVGLTDSVTADTANDSGTTDPVGITDSASANLTTGGTAYTSSPADSEGITDAASYTVAFARTVGDSEGLTDSAVTAIDASRTQGDQVGLTDAAAGALVVVKSQSDQVGLTDVASSVSDVTQTTSEQVGITDAAQAVLAGATQQTPSDQLDISDTLSTAQGSIRSQSDPVGATDAVVLDAARSQADAVGLTDSITAQLDRVVTVDDLLGLIDGTSTSTSTAGSQALDNSEAISDSVDVLAAGDRSLDDGVGLTDDVTAIMNSVLTVDDFLGLTDKTFTGNGRPETPLPRMVLDTHDDKIKLSIHRDVIILDTGR